MYHNGYRKKEEENEKRKEEIKTKLEEEKSGGGYDQLPAPADAFDQPMAIVYSWTSGC